MGQNIPGCGEGSRVGLPMETELVCNVLNPELRADYNLYSSLFSHPLLVPENIGLRLLLEPVSGQGFFQIFRLEVW